jgi:hypothetical protein
MSTESTNQSPPLYSVPLHPMVRHGGAKVTVRPFRDSHPKNQHLTHSIRFEWPSFAETHFVTKAQLRQIMPNEKAERPAAT